MKRIFEVILWVSPVGRMGIVALLFIAANAVAILPTSNLQIDSFTGSYNFGIAEQEGIWRNLEFRIKFTVRGETSIDTFNSDCLENHLFFYSNHYQQYFPMFSSNVVFTNRDSVRVFHKNINMGDKVKYYITCDATFYSVMPDSGLADTVFFYFDGLHWELNDSLGANWSREYFTLLTPLGFYNDTLNIVDPYSRNLREDYNSAGAGAQAFFTTCGTPPPSTVNLEFIKFIPSTWVPSPDDSVGLVFKLTTSSVKRKIAYFISQISQFEGTCMNGPPLAGDFHNRKTQKGQFFDFSVINPDVGGSPKYNIVTYDTTGYSIERGRLVETDVHTITAKTETKVNKDTIYLKSNDYGAHAVVTAAIVDPENEKILFPLDIIIQSLDSDTVRYVAVPKDEDCRVQIQPLPFSVYRTDVGDGMADCWEDSIKTWYLNTTGDSYDIHCLTPYWLYTDSSKFISYADSDFVTQGDTTFGDGLTVFEEYRGFLVEFMTKPYDTLFFERKHIRSNPFIKDLFVSLAPLNRYTIGFADTLPIPVHIIDYSRSTNQLGYTEGYNSDLGGVAPVVNAHHVAAKLPYHRWIYSSMYTIRYKATFAPVLQMIYGMRTWKVGDRRYYIKWPYGFSNFCIDDCLPAYLAYVSGTNVIDLWQQTGIFVNYLQSDLDQMLYKQGMTAAEIDSVKHAGVRKVLGHEIGHIAGIPPLEKFPTEFHYFLAKDDISIMTWGFSMMDSLGKGIPRTYDSQDTSFLRINFRNPFGNQ